MTTPAGSISFSNLNTELRRTATASISLNDTEVRRLLNRSNQGPKLVGHDYFTAPSGAVPMSGLQNKTLGVGLVYSWLSNNGTSSARPYSSHNISPMNIGTSSWTQVAASNDYAFAIKSGGTLWFMGVNSLGVAGNNTTTSNVLSPVQIGTSLWSQVTTSNFGVNAIRSGGTLFGWGRNNWGSNVGSNITTPRSSPIQIGTSSWVAVAVTSNYATAAIKSGGTLWTWGYSVWGQLGNNSTVAARSSAVQVGTSTWSQIMGGYGHFFAIRSNGSLFSWGNNFNGTLGIGTRADRSSPVQIGTSSWIALSGTNNCQMMAAIRLGGNLFTWGTNTSGSLGNSSTIARSSPIQIGSSVWTACAAGISSALFIKSGGTLWGTGSIFKGNYNNNATVVPYITSMSSPIQIGSGAWSKVAFDSAVMGITSTGTLYAWGDEGSSFGPVFSTYGLNLGHTSSLSSPVQIGTTSWIAMANMTGSNYGIDSTGKLFYWGRIESGSIIPVGVGGRFNKPGAIPWVSPVQVGTSSWTAISVGDYTVLAIRAGGTLFSWGNGFYGNLGVNNRTNYSSPVQVGSSSWKIVHAGVDDRSGFAVNTSNQLFAWGENTYGQLGQNDRINRSSPVAIGGMSNVKNISGSARNMAAINNYTLYVWGYDTLFGSLGLNSLVGRSAPVQLGSSSWIQVHASGYNMHAIRSNGTLFGWGYGEFIGDNTTVSKSSPVQIGSSSWVGIISGKSTSCFSAIRLGGTLFTWGNYVPDGGSAFVGRSSPVQIGSSSWVALAAGTSNDTGSAVRAWRI